MCAFFLSSALAGHADQFGLYTYVAYDTYIEITDYPEDATGDIVIPSEIVGKPVTSIGREAFRDCRSLTGVTIPDSVTYIGDSAFFDCNSLTSVTIPESLTSLEDRTFRSCDNLARVTIPDSVTRIGDHAFRNCSSLTSVIIPDRVTHLGVAAFYSCDSLAEVTIGSGVTSMESEVFGNCENLIRVTIREGVTTIAGDMFRNCRNLPQLTIPDSVTRIEGSAFEGCESLAEVIMGSGVTQIGAWAFEDCSSLTVLEIPDHVTRIEDSTFIGCSSLTGFSIPSNVTYVGAGAFAGCDSLMAISVEENNDTYASEDGIVLSKDRTTLTHVPGGRHGAFVIPDGVTVIADRAFFRFAGLTSVTIPEGVTSIERSAFHDCTGLTSVVLPKSITSIGNLAFGGCSSLTSVIFPNSVTGLGGGLFHYCENLVAVYFTGDAPSGSDIMRDAPRNLNVWHYEDATGFTSPKWQDRPTRTYGRLDNLSTRGQVLSGNDILIGGLVIGGEAPRTILVRGIGPALGDFLEPETVVGDPMIVVFSGSDEIVANDNWSDQPDSEAVADLTEAVGAFPLLSGSKDAALRLDLEPGAYSVHLSGKDGTGIGLVELYDGSESGNGRLMNISTRGRVGTGDSIMVPGIVVTDNPRRLLIRGVGPELAESFGFAPESVLPNPILTLKNQDGVTLATNDDWGTNEDTAMIAAVSQQVGAFPLTEGGADAALLIEVQPGVYTAHVSDVSGGEGIAIVEVYGAP